MATAASSVWISDSAAGATPGITPFGRSQAGCPRHSDGAGGGSGIDSKKLTPSGYFLQSTIASMRRISWCGTNSVGVGSEVRRALLGLALTTKQAGQLDPRATVKARLARTFHRPGSDAVVVSGSGQPSVV